MGENNSLNSPINQDSLSQLMSMGVDEDVAREALFCTGNNSVELAINYVFDNHRHLLIEGSASSAERSGSDNEELIDYYKMTFVVNTSLKMGLGKIAAQVAHACLGLYRVLLTNTEKVNVLKNWEYMGEKKIVLKGIDKDHLELLRNKAIECKIPNYLVKDAGHTQIDPGSVTVLSLFGQEDDVNEVTGKLNLL